MNILVRRLQASPQRIEYKAMRCLRQVLVYSDGAFAKEQDEGYGARGMAALRLGRDLNTGALVGHFLDVACTLRLVTRSSYSTEVLSCTGALDDICP